MKKLVFALIMLAFCLLQNMIAAPYAPVINRFKRQCLAGDASGCVDAAMQYKYYKDYSNVKYYLGKGCDLNFGEACYLLGAQYNEEGNSYMGNEAYKKACHLGYTYDGIPIACHSLALNYYEQRNYVEAYQYFGLACRMGYNKSCEIYNLIQQKLNE